MTFDGRILDVLAQETAHGYRIVIEGVPYEVETGRSRTRRGFAGLEAPELIEDDKWVLLAPLTGVVVTIPIGVGDTVKQGDVLMTLEAMKMQNELRARHGGVVTAIQVKVGDAVQIGAPLLEITGEEEKNQQSR